MARKFFYVCGGMLMLALSYHFGASTATAQAPGNPVVSIASNGSHFFAVTSNGDTYLMYPASTGYTWTLVSNVFGEGPVPAQRETWGQVKSRYAPNRGATPLRR